MHTGDILTQEKINICVATGFDEYLLTGEASVYGAVGTEFIWEGSTAKQVVDYLKNAGAERIFLRDNRFVGLIEDYTLPLYGSESAFKPTLNEFDRHTNICLGLYLNDGVNAIELNDEPLGVYTNHFVIMYQSIKRQAKNYNFNDIPIGVCLLPMYQGTTDVERYTIDGKSASETTDTAWTSNQDIYELYRAYVRRYLEAMCLNGDGTRNEYSVSIRVDMYPFRESRFTGGYYATIQILAEECARMGANAGFVIQTFNENGAYKELNEAELYAQVHTLAGFGISDIGFFTYKPSLNNAEYGDSFLVQNDGLQLNDRYYQAQALMQEYKSFDEILCSFEYQGAKIYGDEQSYFYQLATEGFNNAYAFDTLESISIEGTAVLTTELYRESDDLSMYMFQNICDSYYETTETASVTVDFGNTTMIGVFSDGNFSVIDISSNDGAFTALLEYGETIFIIPMN